MPRPNFPIVGDLGIDEPLDEAQVFLYFGIGALVCRQIGAQIQIEVFHM